MRAVATINKQALVHNLAVVRQLAPTQQVFAAVKADAYGHGALQIIDALKKADGFAVATLDEALQLRWAGVTQPIMLLSHAFTHDDLATAAENNIRPTVFHASQLEQLATYQGPTVQFWCIIDSGMHRLGFLPESVPATAKQLAALKHAQCIGWMTHFACADDVNNAQTTRQYQQFVAATQGLAGLRSAANSAAIVAWPQTHADRVRPGIMLYGCSPLLDKTAAEIGLKPVMTLTAKLIAKNHIPAGEPVGYGATWKTSKPTSIGIVGIGYGDGYPRHAASGTPVLINGVRCPLVGRVSMDMLAVDLSAVPDVGIGAQVTLWGDGLPAEEVAAAAETIAYELFCQLTPRVQFRYIEGN